MKLQATLYIKFMDKSKYCIKTQKNNKKYSKEIISEQSIFRFKKKIKESKKNKLKK